jgi:hypothetical protein
VKISQNDLGQKLKAWPSDLNLSSQIGFFYNFLVKMVSRVLMGIQMEVKSKHV